MLRGDARITPCCMLYDGSLRSQERKNYDYSTQVLESGP